MSCSAREGLNCSQCGTRAFMVYAKVNSEINAMAFAVCQYMVLNAEPKARSDDADGGDGLGSRSLM